MGIGNIINECGKDHSPYMSGLVNHLPMAQFALYQMTKDLDKVKSLTRFQIKHSKIDPVRKEYPICESCENCLGNRDMYESYLDLLQREINEGNVINYVKKILNTYPFGMSSGLFHTLIRVYYAVEGFKVEKNLIEEVKRALAYYVTAYREADLFTRVIEGKDIIEEMQSIIDNTNIQEIISHQHTTGQKLKSLYESDEYMKNGFIVNGNKDEKAQALLDMLLPLYIESGSIVVLHCITSLQALLGLEEYYDDFDQAMDILTTSIITHLMTLDNLNFDIKSKEDIVFSWQYILSLASESTNVHNIKFAYSTHKLYEMHYRNDLKRAALKRVDMI